MQLHPTLRGYLSLAFLFLVSLPFLGGCTDDGLTLRGNLGIVEPDTEAEIRLRVTGGFAGVDYTLGLDGITGQVLGVECVSHCDFSSGEILGELSQVTVRHLFQRVEEADMETIHGRDYGTFGADYFHYAFAVAYDGGGEYSVTGTSVLLPAPIQEIGDFLQTFVGPIQPVFLDFGGDPSAWPDDPLGIKEAEIYGDILRIRVEYSGGCGSHEIQGVALGGWMESYPVQVNLFLSHADLDDPCDSIVEEELEFQLSPLRWDYLDTYGVGGKGSDRIYIRLQPLSDAGSDPPFTLLYRF